MMKGKVHQGDIIMQLYTHIHTNSFKIHEANLTEPKGDEDKSKMVAWDSPTPLSLITSRTG